MTRHQLLARFVVVSAAEPSRWAHHEAMIRFGLAALIALGGAALYMILLYRASVTRNRSTAIGLLMGTLMWMAYTYPAFDARNITIGVIMAVAAAYGARWATPFAAWGRNLSTQMRELQKTRKEKERRES